MADRTSIEWTDATWNPTTGCSRVSEGCRNCYAEGIAQRFSAPGAAYHGYASRVPSPRSAWTGRVEINLKALPRPLAWQKPRRIFVNSMSDLFHENLHTDSIALVYGYAIAAHHIRGHTFQVLTKRAARMRDVLKSEEFWDVANATAAALVLQHLKKRGTDAARTIQEYDWHMPPPGIWLGISVEDQRAADERIPLLLEAPAKLHFLSCEPLLGPLLIRQRLERVPVGPCQWPYPPPSIKWVISGGESGRGARPSHPEWHRMLRDQCADAGVPYFFKQWGAWAPPPDGWGSHKMQTDGTMRQKDGTIRGSDAEMARAPQKMLALLDGVEHRAMPEEVA